MTEQVTSTEIMRELFRISNKAQDLYYAQEDLNSDTSKAILGISRMINDLNNLVAFGKKDD